MEGEEEGREERATGWKPCWREERETEESELEERLSEVLFNVTSLPLDTCGFKICHAEPQLVKKAMLQHA